MPSVFNLNGSDFTVTRDNSGLHVACDSSDGGITLLLSPDTAIRLGDLFLRIYDRPGAAHTDPLLPPQIIPPHDSHWGERVARLRGTVTRLQG